MRRGLDQHLGLILRPLQQAGRALVAGSSLHVLLRLLLLASAIGLGGLLYLWSGLISVSASSGHWPATSRLLDFALRHAVETQALGIRAAVTDDPALILKGAAHYASGCAPCHGAPGERPSPIVRHMTPRPPSLAPKIAGWRDRELFWIVRNGLKFTAMPAWPAPEREDEVWAVVAFLKRLPGLSREDYRRLAYGDAADAAADAEVTPAYRQPVDAPPTHLLANCARCHGADGSGRGAGAFPKLAAQSEAYLLASLQAFAKGERKSGIMEPIAAALSERSMRELARHYASQPATTPASPDPPDVVDRGRATARQGVPGAGVPSCVHCHGPSETPRNPYYPALAGQYADYLRLQLELFRTGTRGGTPYANIMHAAAGELTDRQIQEVAAFYASLGETAEGR